MSWLHHLFLPRESNNQRAKLLHPSALSVVIGLFTIFQLAIGQLQRVYPQILGYAAQIAPQEIVSLTNARRQESGFGTLQLDPQLSQAAAGKAADMFARNYWAHTSPQGTQPWVFITDAGYEYRFAGENLARDFSNAADIIQAWMDSPTHRDNLLSNRYTDIGIAVVDGQLEGRETTLVVQMFGTRLAASGQTTGGSTAIIPAVRAAAEPSPAPTQVPSPSPTVIVASTTPFDITKSVSLGLLTVFVVVLAIDLIAMRKRKIMRWTSKSFAHLAFMLFLLIASALVNRGIIL